MPFIFPSDYQVQIKADLLATVTESNAGMLTEAEQTAQEEMSGYLRGRYELSACFVDVLPYVASEQYDTGAVVQLAAVPAVPATAGSPGSPGTPPVAAVPARIYVANRPTAPGEVPGGAPAAGQVGPAWALRDPRHKLLKMYLIDMVLYHIHSGQNPLTVPAVRQDRYDTALQWAKDCRTGKVSPGLPLLPDKKPDGTPNRESIRPRGGSQPKLKNSY
jgi:phage gp36-like protein